MINSNTIFFEELRCGSTVVRSPLAPQSPKGSVSVSIVLPSVPRSLGVVHSKVGGNSGGADDASLILEGAVRTVAGTVEAAPAEVVYLT